MIIGNNNLKILIMFKKMKDLIKIKNSKKMINFYLSNENKMFKVEINNRLSSLLLKEKK